MTYYLQCGVPDNTEGRQESRAFLDDHVHAGCEVVEVVEADTWKQAREQVDA